MNTVKRLNVSVGLGLIFFGMIFSFLPSAPASAALLQFSFTGAVNDVHVSLFPAINNDQTLVGSLTIDTSIPDSNPSVPISQYQYHNAIKSLTLTLGPTNGALVLANNFRLAFLRDRHNRLASPPSGVSTPASFSKP